MVDYIFKRTFTAEDIRSKVALVDLLNSVLKLENTEKIMDFVVMNPEIPVDVGTRKKAVFDIRVKFGGGKQAIVEMQLSGSRSFKKRAQFIVSKAYSSQDIAGERYNALQKCYLICILNFALLEEPAGLVAGYQFRDKDGRELTDDETILFIQLPKVDKILNKPVESMTPVEMWGIFFRYISDKSKRNTLNAIIERKDGIKMAANVLYEISQDEKARIQYENELLADLDSRSWASDAWEDGKEEGIVIGKEEGIVIGKEEGIAIGKEVGIDTTLQVISALMTQTPVDQIAAKYHMTIEQIARIQSTLRSY
jgi:predicted transposase/invertase (TIGR01784 family)